MHNFKNTLLIIVNVKIGWCYLAPDERRACNRWPWTLEFVRIPFHGDRLAADRAAHLYKFSGGTSGTTGRTHTNNRLGGEG